LQTDLDKLCDWSQKWPLQFNPAKCKVMHDIGLLLKTFGADIYAISAFFDPRFKFQWVESLVSLSRGEIIQTLITKLYHTVRAFVEQTNDLHNCSTSTFGIDTRFFCIS